MNAVKPFQRTASGAIVPRSQSTANKALPKSAQMLKASLAPKAAPGPTLTQQILASNLNGRQMSTMHAVIQGGERNPQQVLTKMQQAPKTGRDASVAAAQRAEAAKTSKSWNA